MTVVDIPADALPHVATMVMEREGDWIRAVQLHNDGTVHATAWTHQPKPSEPPT